MGLATFWAIFSETHPVTLTAAFKIVSPDFGGD
jgi:hypothetical protein